MRRVVITGLGAVSCIGNNQAEILDSLKNGRSGIVANESFAEMGLRSQVSGTCDIDLSEHIDRKIKRFMGDAAAYAYISMQQAVDDSGLEESDISNVRSGLIASSGGASSAEIVACCGCSSQSRCAQDWSLRGHQDDEQFHLSLPGDAVQDQRPELFADLCLCHQRTLHRCWR